MGEIDGEEVKEIWFEIFLFLREVKDLKRIAANISDPFGLGTQGFDRALMDVYGFESHTYVDQIVNYIQCDGLYVDLEDLERLLYFLLHTNAKRVHLSCA